MTPNCTIEILAVENGFIVRRPSYHTQAQFDSIKIQDVFSFQTFAELSGWLSGHFNHRCGRIVCDDCGNAGIVTLTDGGKK